MHPLEATLHVRVGFIGFLATLKLVTLLYIKMQFILSTIFCLPLDLFTLTWNLTSLEVPRHSGT